MPVVLGFHAWLVQQKEEDDSILIVITVVLEPVVMDAMIMTAFLCTIELFATVLRSTGLLLGVMSAKFGGTRTPFIKDPEPRIDRELALAMSLMAFTLIGLAVLVLPETMQIGASKKVREAELEDKWQMRSPAETTQCGIGGLSPQYHIAT